MISVVIPTYNRPEYLERAVRSVMNQTWQDLEIIVVDDASVRDSASLVKSLSSDILYHRLDVNRGANFCRNKGVALSGGEYVAFLDDDDAWVADKLQKQLGLIEKEGIDLCYTGRIISTVKDEKVVSTKHSYSRPGSRDPRQAIMKSNYIGTTSSILVRRSSLLAAGGFDENLPALQDYDFYIRFILNGFRVEGIEEGLVDYRVHMDSDAISKNIGQKLKAMGMIARKYRGKPFSRYLYTKPFTIFAKYLVKKGIRRIKG